MRSRSKPWILPAMLGMLASLGGAEGTDGHDSGTIVVVAEGFRNITGQARIAVFSREDGFPDGESHALRKTVVDIKDGRIQVRFEGLPYADYAVSLYHDENGDAKLNKKLFGIPKEGYGVSNNVVPAMRSPKFDEARFALREEVKEVSIHVHY